MCGRLRIWIALLVVAVALPMSNGFAPRAGAQQKKPNVEKPNKGAAENDDDDDDDDDDKPAAAKQAPVRHEDDDEERGEPDPKNLNDASVDEGKDGLPPMPLRAPLLSKRGVIRSSEPFGPEPPPARWSDAEISGAKSACARLLTDGAYEFKTVEPIKEGACGAPAPVRLAYVNHVPRVEVRPGATMTCPLADALDRWLREVVQPRAKALLHANVIRLGNLSAYVCRNRYNSATERISYHAFAEALDVSEFVTAKGEHISVLEHWPANDERSRFLKEVHDGACKIFGTVLGPEANAAHKNHFHFDMAKRRRSAYCQ
jgi:hypothetical protein